jgi:hypothetical protein
MFSAGGVYGQVVVLGNLATLLSYYTCRGRGVSGGIVRSKWRHRWRPTRVFFNGRWLVRIGTVSVLMR